MADEKIQPDDANEQGEREGAKASPRADDKSPSPGSEIKNAGELPKPEHAAANPESQAALTGKAPSGSSTSGTTVPASTSESATASTSTETPALDAQPPGGESPKLGDPLKSPAQSDLEKAAKIAEAKARAAAAKQAAGDKLSPQQPAAAGAAGAPKAPVKKKDEGPKPADASDHSLIKNIRETFDGAVLEATEFIG
ncbi:MAG TPA: hypothetical protein VKB86_01550, partial [Pyrinomonadaceae bacterium]|nr:hypothetical protein [Pyrinomonadaceae bacterium]